MTNNVYKKNNYINYLKKGIWIFPCIFYHSTAQKLTQFWGVVQAVYAEGVNKWTKLIENLHVETTAGVVAP